MIFFPGDVGQVQETLGVRKRGGGNGGRAAWDAYWMPLFLKWPQLLVLVVLKSQKRLIWMAARAIGSGTFLDHGWFLAHDILNLNNIIIYLDPVFKLCLCTSSNFPLDTKNWSIIFQQVFHFLSLSCDILAPDNSQLNEGPLAPPHSPHSCLQERSLRDSGCSASHPCCTKRGALYWGSVSAQIWGGGEALGFPSTVQNPPGSACPPGCSIPTINQWADWAHAWHWQFSELVRRHCNFPPFLSLMLLLWVVGLRAVVLNLLFWTANRVS